MIYDRIKIGVLGRCPGAGTGFLASCLASAMTDIHGMRPVVLELGDGGLFDCLGIDKRFPSDQFIHFHNMTARDRSIRGRSNELDGINWMLIPSGENNIKLDLIKKMRLMNSALGNVILCRLNGIEEDELWRLLWEMDHILVVIDPLPSRMLVGYDLLCKLRTSELPVTYIVNKYNKGVNRRELLGFLNIKDLYFIPWLPPEAIYGAEYLCCTVYDLPLAKRQLVRPLRILIEELFSPDNKCPNIG